MQVYERRARYGDAPDEATSSPAGQRRRADYAGGRIRPAGPLADRIRQGFADRDAPRPNRTGIPDRIKERFERSYGFALDDVQVHYGSSEPAKLDAQAFTRGSQIHIGPGQEAHLGHELGHVVQQKRGQVEKTADVNGVSVNDDRALEREADRMGQGLHGPVGKTARQGAAPPAPDAPVQMAGHKGVMVFSVDTPGKILKRVEANEFLEFCRVEQMQQSADQEGATEQEKLSAKVFPKIYTTLGAKPELGDLSGMYRREAFEEWAGEHKDGDFYVEMESLGGSGFGIKDFKTGTTSAVAEELRGHGHKSSVKSAEAKERRMRRRDDTKTETAEYGIRDSDAVQQAWAGIRRWAGRYTASLTAIKQELQGRSYSEDSQVIRDLDNIIQYLNGSDTVYVASSVIIKWKKGQTASAPDGEPTPIDTSQDRARIIDLAHPIDRRTFGRTGQFEQIKRGMVGGVVNIRRMLLGQEIKPVAELEAVGGSRGGAAAPESEAAPENKSFAERRGIVEQASQSMNGQIGSPRERQSGGAAAPVPQTERAQQPGANRFASWFKGLFKRG